MIPPLVSFALAKEHLRIINDDMDRLIDVKLRLASAIVVNHCKLKSIPEEWFVNSSTEPDFESTDLILFSDTVSSPPGLTQICVPGNLQAAILLVLGDLFENGESSSSDLLSDAVINLLAPFRDPTMA